MVGGRLLGVSTASLRSFSRRPRKKVWQRDSATTRGGLSFPHAVPNIIFLARMAPPVGDSVAFARRRRRRPSPPFERGRAKGARHRDTHTHSLHLGHQPRAVSPSSSFPLPWGRGLFIRKREAMMEPLALLFSASLPPRGGPRTHKKTEENRCQLAPPPPPPPLEDGGGEPRGPSPPSVPPPPPE